MYVGRANPGRSRPFWPAGPARKPVRSLKKAAPQAGPVTQCTQLRTLAQYGTRSREDASGCLKLRVHCLYRFLAKSLDGVRDNFDTASGLQQSEGGVFDANLGYDAVHYIAVRRNGPQQRLEVIAVHEYRRYLLHHHLLRSEEH